MAPVRTPNDLISSPPPYRLPPISLPPLPYTFVVVINDDNNSSLLLRASRYIYRSASPPNANMNNAEKLVEEDQQPISNSDAVNDCDFQKKYSSTTAGTYLPPLMMLLPIIRVLRIFCVMAKLEAAQKRLCIQNEVNDYLTLLKANHISSFSTLS